MFLRIKKRQLQIKVFVDYSRKYENKQILNLNY